MTDRNQPDSTLYGSNRQFTSLSLANFLAFCLSFISLAVALSEIALGHTLGKPAQQSSQAPREAGSGGGAEKELHSLELNQPTKRALAGGQQHSYQITLDADQLIVLYGDKGEYANVEGCWRATRRIAKTISDYFSPLARYIGIGDCARQPLIHRNNNILYLLSILR